MSKVFPNIENWLSDQWLPIYYSGCTASLIRNQRQVKVTLGNPTENNKTDTRVVLRSPEIDLTYFKSLKIIGDAYMGTKMNNIIYSPHIYLSNGNENSRIKLYEYTVNTSGNMTINIIEDISDLSGNYSVDLELLVYNWSDILGVGNYISLTKCELS